ncbi:LPS translocon maturation chaperone LptM [Paracidovorax cattleyae]|uniref:Lipoprotein-attachment site-containing protein n=1 Tax=Paracidovorax cattleyae TaxID=80868 RepID=A0A1H0UCA9_9BURK|nr:lipoprotein-attachment site-containing protein [Paracidovorax cattleyae]
MSVLAAGTVAALTGCGQRGPLYLPGDAAASQRATLPQTLDPMRDAPTPSPIPVPSLAPAEPAMPASSPSTPSSAASPASSSPASATTP